MIEAIQYTPEENIRRIKIEKNTKFVLVEGEFDVPIYDAMIQQNNVEYDVVWGGGKAPILNFVSGSEASNFISVLDLDFDYDDRVDDPRVIYIDVYSMENYMIEQEVALAVITHAVNQSRAHVLRWFKYDDWLSEVKNSCSEMLKSLYYNQKVVVENRVEWNRRWFLQGRTWKFDMDKVHELIKDISDAAGVSVSHVKKSYPKSPVTNNKFIKYFPGKILITSLFRYVKDNVPAAYAARFNGRCTNEAQFYTLAAASIGLMRDMSLVTEPINTFLIAA